MFEISKVICEDPDIIRSNIRETKLKSPDYAGTALIYSF